MSDREIKINVPALTRVEGEGALHLEIRDNVIESLQLRIFEPPRLFEKFLEGKHYTEVPDIVARICGICPVAYQMSAVHAFESLFKVEPGPWVRAMRRLFYCGEWIESHALHIHLLAAPDFLGYENVADLAKDFPAEVRRGIRIQHLGNEILKLLGGRSVHPVGVKVGGFHHAPALDDVKQLQEKLRAMLPEVVELVNWVAALKFPEIHQSFTSVSLRHPREYPMNEGRIDSSIGHNLGIHAFSHHFSEQHEPHSTALYCYLDEKPYLVGPLARLNLNHDRLPDDLQRVLQALPMSFPSDNMYHSIVARALEVLFAFQEAIEIMAQYEIPMQPYVEVNPVMGVAYGCTEAPRGILWHRYEVDSDGIIQRARIVPPTSQNQARIEEDLHASLSQLGFEKDDATIRASAEQIIRNYDPCISCATHFLDLNINRL